MKKAAGKLGKKTGKACRKHRECGPVGYCALKSARPVGAKSLLSGKCQHRTKCRDTGKGAPCPTAHTDWPWHFDSSVLPMDSAEAEFKTERDGVPVEVVAPGPPSKEEALVAHRMPLRGKTGLRSIADMLTMLRWIGVQMG